MVEARRILVGFHERIVTRLLLASSGQYPASLRDELSWLGQECAQKDAIRSASKGLFGSQDPT
jgi:hypothetical protein